MKPLRIACAWIAWAAVAGACTDGPAGPASSPFNPFGTEVTVATGNEPAPSGLDPPPGGGVAGQSVSQLCALDCSRIEAACPGSTSPTCVASCSSLTATYPMCTAQIQSYLVCVAAAPLVCNAGSIEITGCDGADLAVGACANQAPTGSM